VSRRRLGSSRLWRWGPLILWMALISLGSTDVLASDETSRFIVPFLRWLLPGAAPATLDLLHEAIRKLGHVSEFAILAVLWYRSLTWERQARRPKVALAAFALTLAFAGLDEVHQAFVATRTASVTDVGWDGLGALCGVVGSGVLWGGRGALRAKNSDAPKEDPPGRLTVPFDG
jgi:VanZ family protein